MIGATAKSEQFMTRTGNESTKGSRKGFALLCGGEDPVDHLSDEEKRASLIAVVKALQLELAEAKSKREIYRVKQIGMKLLELNGQIHDLRPKRSSPAGLSNFFIDVCREQMSNPQFKATMDEANRRQREFLLTKKDKP